MKIIPIIQCLFEEIESESPINMEIATIDASESPIYLGMAPIDAPKSPIYLGIAPIDAPKSPIYLGMPPIDAPKSPIDACEARAPEENRSGKYRSLQKVLD